MIDGKFMVCARVDAVREIVAGVTKGTCSECQKEVWMAPSSCKLVADDPDVKVLCQPCGARLINASTGDPVYAMAPGALQELLRYQMKVHRN